MTRRLSLPQLVFAVALAAAIAGAAAAIPLPNPPPAGKSRALILAGLPGDEEHEQHFGSIAQQWRDWLTGPLGFAATDVRILFGDVRCREQVFWMTTSASGWFLKSLAAKGRIVITASLPEDEFNETEFPEALANAAKLPLEQLDDNKDGKISILELYRHVLT